MFQSTLARRVVYLLAVAICGLCLTAAADVIEIPASRDATLYESAAGEVASGSGAFLFVGKNLHGTLDRYRSVLYFDVSSVPVGVQVTDVQLKMYMSRTTAGATDITLHAVTHAWGEGSSVASGTWCNGSSGPSFRYTRSLPCRSFGSRSRVLSWSAATNSDLSCPAS